jgi:hypothetical protein
MVLPLMPRGYAPGDVRDTPAGRERPHLRAGAQMWVAAYRTPCDAWPPQKPPRHPGPRRCGGLPARSTGLLWTQREAPEPGEKARRSPTGTRSMGK